VRGRGGFGPVLGFSGGLTERKKLFEVEFFPGRVSPVGWAAFPAGKGITEQGLHGMCPRLPLRAQPRPPAPAPPQEAAAAAAGKPEQPAEKLTRQERRSRSSCPALGGSFTNRARREQVAGGWPAWLSAVTGEAIDDWTPRRADFFEKIDKVRARSIPAPLLSHLAPRQLRGIWRAQGVCRSRVLPPYTGAADRAGRLLTASGGRPPVLDAGALRRAQSIWVAYESIMVHLLELLLPLLCYV
jgi:hypothetical protein